MSASSPGAASVRRRLAFEGLAHQEMPRATSALNVVQRIAGSLGTALLAVVLQRSITTELPGLHGGLGQAAARVAADPTHTQPALAHAFGTTFWVALVLTVAALVPALMLPKRQRAAPPHSAPAPVADRQG